MGRKLIKVSDTWRMDLEHVLASEGKEDTILVIEQLHTCLPCFTSL